MRKDLVRKARATTFAREYEGVSIDFDGMFGAQCVDLFRHALLKIYGVQRNMQPNTTPSGGAKDLINNPTSRVQVVTDEPKAGDFVIWKGLPKNSNWGHVALLLDVNELGIEVLEQDGLNQGRGAQRRVYPINDEIAGYMRAV